MYIATRHVHLEAREAGFLVFIYNKKEKSVYVCVYPFIFTDFLELLGHTTC